MQLKRYTLAALLAALILALGACGGEKTYDAAHQCSSRIDGLCGRVGAKPVTADKCKRIEDDNCILKYPAEELTPNGEHKAAK